MSRLSLVLLSIVISSAYAVSACGNLVNVEVIGKTAVTVDEAGQPIIVIQVCDQDIDTLVLARTREGLSEDEPNTIEGTWKATTPQTGLVEVRLGSATSGWTGPVVALEPSRGYVLDGTSSSADAVTSQVTFTAMQIATLTSDQVISGDGAVIARAAFEADACSS